MSPSKRLSGKTPEEAWSGKKVSVKHLLVFGCESFANVKIMLIMLNEISLNPKAIVVFFLAMNVYRLYDLPTNKVIRSRDVVCNETFFPGTIAWKRSQNL